MKRFTLPLFVIPATLTALAAPALGAPQFERILSADSDFVLLIRDVGSLTEKLRASPWSGIWAEASEDVDAMPDTTREKWETLQEVVDLLSHIQGPAAMVADMGDLNYDAMKSGSEKDRRWALLVGKENEDVVRSMLNEERDQRWATVKNVSILCGSDAYLQELSNGIRNGVETPLGAGRDFRSLQDYHGNPDVTLYLDLKPLIALLRQAAEAAEREKTEPGQMEAMGFTPGKALDALHLEALRAFGTGIGLQEDGVQLTGGLLASGDEGVMKLLAYLPGPCPKLPFIPEQVQSASVYRYDIPSAWDGVWTVLNAMSPTMAGLMQTQLDQLTMASNVDLRRDVIDHLGETLFSVTFPAAGGQHTPGRMTNQVIGLELHDRAAFESSIHTLLESLGANESLQTREVAGASILSMPFPGGQGEATLAFTDRYFLIGIGDPGNVDTILQSMKKPGPSIWNRADVKPYLASVPEKASGFGVSDLGAMLGSIFKDLPAESRGKMPEADFDRVIHALGIAVSHQIKTPEGFFSTTRLFYRKP